VAALILALNLGSPILFRAACAAARIDITPTILGRLEQTAFENHRARQEYLWWDRARWNSLLKSTPPDTLFIGQWVDLAGMYLNATRRGDVVITKMIRYDRAGHLFECQIGPRRIYFLEWYPDAPKSLIPDEHGPVVILSRYPPAAMSQLPPGAQFLAPPAMEHRPF